jgi:hypothetical protein
MEKSRAIRRSRISARRPGGRKPTRNPKNRPEDREVEPRLFSREMVDATESGLVFHYEMAREPRAKPDNQEPTRKPRPGQRIRKVQKQPRKVSRSDSTTHWGKIFQKGFEKFQISSLTLGRLLQSKMKEMEAKIRDSTSACVIPH